ncbi:MAG: hypothetical protein OXB94_01105 [Nitrospira sp.]|nr:hypothetical protein [Nitrospira sp.]
MSKRVVGHEAQPPQGAGAPGALPGLDTGRSRNRRRSGAGRSTASFTGETTPDT